MERLVVSLLALIVIGHLMKGVSCNPPCQWNGFGGCECNILGACNEHGKHQSDLDNKLTGYAPSGLEIFSNDGSQKQNLAYLCEGNTVAILYDCNKRIPLYAATVMSGDQLNSAGFSRPSIDFRRSNDPLLNPQYQQRDNDYSDAMNREICYHTQAKSLLLDYRWYNSLNPSKPIAPPFPNCHQLKPDDKKVAVHKGHLIAAGYGRGDPARAAATFTYTNVVPQFEKFNIGKWMAIEKRLVRWGRDNCATKNTKNVNMYIVVGAIPSTYMYSGGAGPRYVGSKGFSDYMDNVSYRINVPSKMWTAACCTFQIQDASGKWVEKLETRHTAFWRENNPGKEPCEKEDIIKSNNLFDQHPVNLFPASHSSCSDSKNYVPIY